MAFQLISTDDISKVGILKDQLIITDFDGMYFDLTDELRLKVSDGLTTTWVCDMRFDGPTGEKKIFRYSEEKKDFYLMNPPLEIPEPKVGDMIVSKDAICRILEQLDVDQEGFKGNGYMAVKMFEYSSIPMATVTIDGEQQLFGSTIIFMGKDGVPVAKGDGDGQYLLCATPSGVGFLKYLGDIAALEEEFPSLLDMKGKFPGIQTKIGELDTTLKNAVNDIIKTAKDLDPFLVSSQFIENLYGLNIDGLTELALSMGIIKHVLGNGSTMTFSFTGAAQSTTLPRGKYKIECAGAQGGTLNTANEGGKGGKTIGALMLDAPTTLHIYVGNAGTLSVVGWNGGGIAGGAGYCGGGATDIRLTGGTWDNIDSLRSRIMVAAGGGGASSGDSSKGHGGGLTGTNTSRRGTSGGGTQTFGGFPSQGIATPGDFGEGGTSAIGYTSSGGGGGGAGYYGGAGGANDAPNWNDNDDTAGAGGSSFISGHTGCNAINSTGDHTGQPNHFSGMVFTETSMITGDNPGNGYVIITPLEYDIINDEEPIGRATKNMIRYRKLLKDYGVVTEEDKSFEELNIELESFLGL